METNLVPMFHNHLALSVVIIWVATEQNQ